MHTHTRNEYVPMGKGYAETSSTFLGREAMSLTSIPILMWPCTHRTLRILEER